MEMLDFWIWIIIGLIAFALATLWEIRQATISILSELKQSRIFLENRFASPPPPSWEERNKEVAKQALHSMMISRGVMPINEICSMAKVAGISSQEVRSHLNDRSMFTMVGNGQFKAI